MPDKKTIQELLEFSIIVLDKESGITSFKAIENIKNLLGLRKVGHFGTLDPKVTGVLPFALNRACKLSDYFMKKNKTYVGKMYIHKEISKEKLQEEMNKFIGEITQKPPVKSRVKRVERQRQVKKFEILEFNKKKVEFYTEVEAGTYIRKLIHDLGQVKGIGGAHMIQLRRTKAGIFNDKQTHTFEEIEKAFEKYKKGDEEDFRKMLIPAEIIKEIIPEIQVKQESINQLLNGKPLMKQDLEENEFKKFKELKSDKISIFCGSKFIEIVIKEEKIDNEDIIAKPEFVY